MKTHCKHGHEFTPENTGIRPNGYSRCRECDRIKSREWLAKPENKAKAKLWYKRNYAGRRDYILSYKEKYRSEKRHIAAKYNLPTTYAEMVAAQNGLCAACKEPPDHMGLCVDHDHSCCPDDSSCGKCVRGLLCFSCNYALGFAKDSEERLLALVAYLRQHRVIELVS